MLEDIRWDSFANNDRQQPQQKPLILMLVGIRSMYTTSTIPHINRGSKIKTQVLPLRPRVCLP